MNRPITTLFMLASVDGKISTGSTDKLDVDKDFPRIRGIKEGLKQYYTLEQTTDLYSLNSGRVLAKIGVNKLQRKIIKLPVSFLIIDNKPHLNKIGVDNLIRKSKKLIDKISIVVAPALVGGKDTSSLIDGKSLSSVKELSNIKALRLTGVKKLNDSYIFLKYGTVRKVSDFARSIYATLVARLVPTSP